MKIEFCLHPRQISIGEVEKLLPEIIEVMERHDISFSYLLGSILLEDVKARDLDVGIYIKHPTRSIFDYYNDVYFNLCDIFKADNIDVVVLNNVGPTFRYEAIKTGRLIYYRNHVVLEEFIEDTLFQYSEIMPFKEEYRRQLCKRAKEGLLMAKRRLNREKIDMFIDSMNRALNEIKFNIRDINDLTAFRETKQVRDLSVHYLRIALEGVLDICRHIIAVKGFGIPDMETENLIDVLGMNGVVPTDFARKIRGMQGMRNAIVHVYWNLDYEKVYRMITENLSDFEDFVRYAIEYIEMDSDSL